MANNVCMSFPRVVPPNDTEGGAGRIFDKKIWEESLSKTQNVGTEALNSLHKGGDTLSDPSNHVFQEMCNRDVTPMISALVNEKNPANKDQPIESRQEELRNNVEENQLATDIQKLKTRILELENEMKNIKAEADKAKTGRLKAEAEAERAISEIEKNKTAMQNTLREIRATSDKTQSQIQQLQYGNLFMGACVVMGFLIRRVNG